MTPELVPHFILAHHAQGHQHGRFEAASLFVDLAGFTAMTTALMQHGTQAAELMADMMGTIFTPLVDAVYQQGGFITTFAGDGFTALFPHPDPMPTGTQPPTADHHALAAALSIQSGMAALSAQETPYGRFAFSVKVGVGAGEVEWGILLPGQEGAGQSEAEVKAAYYFRGPAVDSAAAAEHQASASMIILSPASHAALQPLVQTTPMKAVGYARVLAVTGALPRPNTAPPAALLRREQDAFIHSAILSLPSRGEFRQVVALIVNLAGITSHAQLAAFMQVVFALQRQYGGYQPLVNFGDKGCTLLLYWGAPTSHEHDLARALQFLLALPTRTSIIMRAGLTVRQMYAGLGGSPRRAAFACYGDGVNLAARMMMHAPWGELWLDEATARLAQRHVVLEPQGQFAFKGFPDAQSVYAVLTRREGDEARFFQGLVVGRGKELRQLATFVQPLLAPAGGVRFAGLLVVEGEAGLGKSRLLHTFVQDPRSPLAGHSQHFLGQVDGILRAPLNPFRYWLRHYFEQVPTAPEDQNKHAFRLKLEQLIAATPDADLQRELRRLHSVLGALVDLVWEDSLYLQLEPQARHENTLIAIKTLLRAESLRRPVVLVLEDLHWLDDASRDFLPSLLRQMDPYPLAILATTRPLDGTDLAGLLARLPHQVIHLNTLTPAELGTLAEAILGAPPAVNLLALLTARADGNPFFAEQMLLYLRETGTIQLGAGSWELTGPGETEALPDDLRAVFIARLDQLAQEVKEVVQTAAVLGREFEVAVLGAMLHDEDSLREWLGLAEQASIWSALNEMRYLFKHVLLRDAIYEMQLLARRRALHYLAAQVLETLYAADLPPHYGELAYHYERAFKLGLAEAQLPACAYLHRAGMQAAERFQNSAAVDAFSRALALVPADDDERRFQLLLQREAVYHVQGDRQAQGDDLVALAILAAARQHQGDQAEVALRQAQYAFFAHGDYQASLTAAQEAVRLAQIADATAIEAAAHLAWGYALGGQAISPDAFDHLQQALFLAQATGDTVLEARVFSALSDLSKEHGDFTRARDFLTQALLLARAVGRRQIESYVLHRLGAVAWRLAEYEVAQGYLKQSLAIWRETGDRWGESLSVKLSGRIAFDQGAYGVAAAAYEQVLRISRDVGDRRHEGIILNDLGVLAQRLGDYEQAYAAYQQSLVLGHEVQDRRDQARTLCNLAALAEGQGDYATARSNAEQALALAREVANPVVQSNALTHLGEALLGMGCLDEATVVLAEALAQRQEIGQTIQALETGAALARLALAQGDLAQAHAEIAPILAHLDMGHSLAGSAAPLRVHLTCYQVLQASGDPRAADLLRAAYEQLQEQAAHLPDDGTRHRFLTNVPWHLELVAAWEASHSGTPAPHISQDSPSLSDTTTTGPAALPSLP